MKGNNSENYRELMFAQLDQIVWNTEMVLSLTLSASIAQEFSLVLQYYLHNVAISFAYKIRKNQIFLYLMPEFCLTFPHPVQLTESWWIQLGFLFQCCFSARFVFGL